MGTFLPISGKKLGKVEFKVFFDVKIIKFLQKIFFIYIISKMKPIILLSMILAIFNGCATNPDKIPASYVSPLIYKDYDDDQIIAEMDHVGRRTTELYNSLKKKSSGDNAQMAIGLVLFWPVLFALEGGDGPEAAEYARLRGEYEALRKIAVQRKIGLEKLPPSPQEIIEAQKEEDKAANSQQERNKRPTQR